MTLGTLKCTTLEDDASNTITVANIVAKPDAASPTFTGTVNLPATTNFANASTFEILDNNANAFQIDEGTNNYINFNTTNSAEQIDVAKKVQLAEDLEFSAAKDILIPDNQATALEIKEGSNAYMTFTTTNSGERVVANKNFQADVTLTDASDLSSGTDLDLSSKNFFHRQVSGNVTYTFSNPPASGTVVGFTLEVDYESGTITWPASVEWAADTPPTLTAAHTSVFVFYTRDNGATYRGAYLVDFDD